MGSKDGRKGTHSWRRLFPTYHHSGLHELRFPLWLCAWAHAVGLRPITTSCPRPIFARGVTGALGSLGLLSNQNRPAGEQR
jgi:hypothetical protein